MPERTLKIFDFDTKEFPFAKWAKTALRIDDLARLHERYDLNSLPVYQAIEICRNELAAASGGCDTILRRFYQDHVARCLGIAYSGFQCPPTFRVHLPACPTVSSFHRDMDYGMKTDRLCLWLPLTRVWGTNSLWIHDNVTNSHEPMCLAYGQFIVFDSAATLHGSVENTSDSTRVSFDSRFAPKHSPRAV
jgi:hypothetical protein